MRVLPASLLLLLFPSGSALAATATAAVCVRNDGVGTFSSSDMSLFADSDWNAGDRTGSGPGTTLAPGQGNCVSMTGLYAWNGYQYQYRFDASFMDTTGTVTFSSPSGLRLGSSGTYYVGANGLSTSRPSLSSYVSVVNAAPQGFSSATAYANYPYDDTQCYVYWSGLTLANARDWDHSLLQRSTSANGTWTTIWSQYSWGYQNRTDTGLSPGTTYWYRVIVVDE